MRYATNTALALCLTSLTPVAQSPQVPGTIRSGITLVPVDVRVLDRDGKPITDLTQDDFTIFENGVPQNIRQFERQAMSAEPPAPGASPMLRSALAPEGGPQKHRTFLLVMGRGRLQHPSKGIDAAIRFVREKLLPQDHVAVMAYNRATDFTTDHAGIAEVLERFRKDHESIESKLSHAFADLQGLYGGRPIPAKAQVQIDAVFKGRLDFRTVPPGRITDAGRITDDSRNAAQTLLSGDLSNSGARSGGDMSLDEHIGATTSTATDLENLYTGIEYLRYIEGEKRLVFITQRGLFLPRQEDDMSLAAIANDARVVLDTIHTGGVSGGGRPSLNNPAPIPGPSFTETFALGTLKTMSDLSGGVWSVYAYADEATARIDEVSRFSYLLAYASTNPTTDGKYRRITVKVNRPGVSVQYRRGYYGRAQLVPYDRREFLTYSRVLAAALYPQPITDILLRLKTKTERGDDGVELIAEIEIDLKRVRFVERDGRMRAQLDISLYTANADGRGIGEMARKFDLSYSLEEYTRASRGDVSYTMRLKTGVYPRLAKVVVYDYAADVIGTAESKVY